MNFEKRRIKVILTLLSLLGCAAILVWLGYLSSNHSRLPSPAAGGSYTIWEQSIGDGPNATPVPADHTLPKKASPTALPTVNSGVERAKELTTQEARVDWHYVDPDTQKAIKILLASDTPGPGLKTAPALALPPQFRPGLYNPLGPSSISLETFQHFLKQGDSPALAEAASMYNACMRLFCDPAVALAFFQHESSMGRQGIAAETRSLGNIRCVAGTPCRTTSNNGSFKLYASWTDGVIDWVILIRETYATKWKLYSLEQIIPRYAPSADNNNPTGYINAVKNLVDKYRNFRP